jgi:parallel beta-helix repeat protein
MTRFQLVLSASCVVLVLIAWQAARSNAPGASASLPGARPAIDASQYPTLQAAIDALPAGGGLVRIPAGTFEIKSPLRITQEDVLLEGEGTATHIKNVNSDGKPAILIGAASLEKDPKAKLWRIQLANLRVTGNEKSGHGILAVNINEIFLHGVTVSYHGQDGIRLDNCYEDPRVSNSLLTYNKGSGLHLAGCHDIVVSGNQFEENQDALKCLDSFNLCMTGNNLDDHLGNGVVIENTYGSVVSGNMIEECNGTAIILDRDCYGITLSSNVIAHEVTGGIDLRDAHGCAVSANTFTIVKAKALVIGPKSGRITVTGNNFSNSYIGEGGQKRQKTDSAAAGIVLLGTSDIAISGNVFSGLSTKALSLEGGPSSRILFSNNIVTENESEHGKLEKSLVSGNLE